MRRALIIFLLLIHPWALAQEQAAQPWLGLHLRKPDPSVGAQISALPQGVGFLITSIEPDGPADRAGMQELDLLWKLDDQLLINEGQLATLLNLSKPGDPIALSIFRAGQPLQINIQLGKNPSPQRSFPDSMIESVLFSSEASGPMRVVNVAEKVASFTHQQGTASLQRLGNIDRLIILGPDQKLIYQTDLSQDDSLKDVPEPWSQRVLALRRGLDQALNASAVPIRQPRPRIILPSDTTAQP
ncbi:MAG: PDZ domain-containing protein [Verrucomicrobia bacterium]|nr:MAG: PDZ domain-containing protein [Verrucomicrobiota bacterium]